MKLAILAGGKGTRLGFRDIPKPLVSVAGKPILEHQILLARKFGIKEIFILSGYMAEKIKEYFGEGSSFGLRIKHIVENKPLGTAGAVKLLEGEVDERFMIFYGDVIMDFNVDSFIAFDRKNNSIASILVHPNDHPYDSDLVEVDRNNRVTAFHSKPHKEGVYYSNLVNAAVYILSPKIFNFLRTNEFSDFGRDIFPDILKADESIYAYITPEYIKDMGTPDRLRKVEQDMISGKIARKNIENKQKAIFLDRDGVLNYDDGFITNTDKFVLLPGVTEALRKINKAGFLAVLVTNQPGIAKGFLSEDQLKEIHKKLEYTLGLQGAYLDRIYYCPHHPDSGFPGERVEYKIVCGCRKPNTGMIEEAKKDLNIDCNQSYIIGDSFRDIICGRNSGLTAVAVRTGKGLKDKYVEPDYFFENISDAVDFIVDDPFFDQYLKIKKLFLKDEINDKPFVISIGGLTRSGKTTLSAYLKKKFIDDGIMSSVISLDNWLLSKDERTSGSDVYNRFQIERINRDLDDFFKGKEIEIHRYSPLDRIKMDTKVAYKNNNPLIIIDGIVALSSEIIRNNSNIKIFCDVNDDLLYRRFKQFYKWKNLHDDDINEIFKQRISEEYTLIRNDRNYADIIINT